MYIRSYMYYINFWNTCNVLHDNFLQMRVALSVRARSFRAPVNTPAHSEKPLNRQKTHSGARSSPDSSYCSFESCTDAAAVDDNVFSSAADQNDVTVGMSEASFGEPDDAIKQHIHVVIPTGTRHVAAQSRKEQLKSEAASFNRQRNGNVNRPIKTSYGFSNEFYASDLQPLHDVYPVFEHRNIEIFKLNDNTKHWSTTKPRSDSLLEKRTMRYKQLEPGYSQQSFGSTRFSESLRVSQLRSPIRRKTLDSSSNWQSKHGVASVDLKTAGVHIARGSRSDTIVGLSYVRSTSTGAVEPDAHRARTAPERQKSSPKQGRLCTGRHTKASGDRMKAAAPNITLLVRPVPISSAKF